MFGMCSSLLPTAAWDILGWMVGRFGCWNQEDQKDKGGEMQDTMRIYIYHEISLAMSWMLPDEWVLVSNKLLIETPRSETKRNRIAVILGGSVY